jgi:hypothetical protein
MQGIAVFIDDAAHALPLLAPILAPGAAGASWVVVLCPPRLNRRLGRWLPAGSRESWRQAWAKAQRERLAPLFVGSQSVVCEWVIASGPLDRLSARLRGQLGAELHVLDLRHPVLGEQPPAAVPGEWTSNRWALPLTVSSSVAAVLSLAD